MMSLRNSTNDSSLEKHSGVITRICSFKYGFLTSEGHENIFFHFSELSDDAKAVVETGSQVTFCTRQNDWTADKKMKAIRLEVVGSPEENAFKNIEGRVKGDMKSRGFTFIERDEETYLFHATNLVDDDASKQAGNTVKEGHMVMFDAEWNHKYNPPKPFAKNVRIIPGQTDLNAAAAALDLSNTSHALPGSTWQRGSRLGMLFPEDETLPLDSPDQRTSSSSPPRDLNRSSSINNRASALRASGPVRRWSRTTNVPSTGGEGVGDSGDEKRESMPAGGLRLTVTTCKFGRKCTRNDCWFDHPNGRQMEDGRLSLTEETEGDAGEDIKVASMGKASLQLLVKAIISESGKNGYLHIRNTLQKQAYVGRALTLEEKDSIGEILEHMELDSPDSVICTNSSRSSFKNMAKMGTGNYSTGTSQNKRDTLTCMNRGSFNNSKAWRSSRSSLTGTGGRVSLADMCRDPSLHSRLSAANTTAACP